MKLNSIKNLMIISVSAILVLVLYIVFVLSPSYTNLLVDMIEKDAINDVATVSTDAFSKFHNFNEAILTDAYFEEAKIHLQARAIKIKVFDKKGTILYSTAAEEIGSVNNHTYFREEVARGKTYTKVVQKETPTLEGKISDRDVVEIYIPVMQNGEFARAFEVYYDITEKKMLFNALTKNLFIVLFSILLPLLFIIGTTALKAHRYYMRHEEAKEALKNSLGTLKIEMQERKKHEEQLKMAFSVFKNTIEGIVITNSQGVIERINPAFTAITGYDESTARGNKMSFLKSNHHSQGFYQSMWRKLTTRGSWKGEIWNRRKNGEVYPQWLSIASIKGDKELTTHYVGIFHDITEIKTSEERLAFQATHDSLTGLPNRKLMDDRLAKAIFQAKRNQTGLAVLFIDLDDFKNINDSLGHPFGDALLQEVAKKLIQCCRAEDTVSRFGGDEFVILLPEVHADEPAAVRVAQRILESIQYPVNIQGKSVSIKASIGITLYPQDGTTPALLLKNADIAMYQAKLKGKNSYALFTQELDAMVQRRITLENDMRKALDRKEFRVFYQPKIDIHTDAIVGMEALVRWQRQDGEIVLPDEFIRVAEETGLIVELGNWVLDTACRQTMLWHRQGFHDLGISVNLSAKQFQEKELLNQIKEKIHRFLLPAECLTLEITENIVMKDVESAIALMNQLSQSGVRLSMDDFGTGYSSLAYLRRFPIHELKIDKSFIFDTPHDKEASNIVKSIVSLAGHLHLKVVAEGVETAAHVDFLKSIGMRIVQGYFYSRPLPSTAFETLLCENKKNIGSPAPTPCYPPPTEPTLHMTPPTLSDSIKV